MPRICIQRQSRTKNYQKGESAATSISGEMTWGSQINMDFDNNKNKIEFNDIQAEYLKWRETQGCHVPSEELLFAFLSEQKMLRPKPQERQPDWMNAKYRLEITLRTDNDYVCRLQHPKLEEDGEWYFLNMYWHGDRETAVAEALELLAKMKASIDANRLLKSMLDEFFDTALGEIRRNGCTNQWLFGNYDGTKISFW